MKIEGEHVFNGPRQEVWQMFYDPAILSSAVPGMEKLEMAADGGYVGIMNVRVGPVSGKFDVKLSLSDINEPESLTLTVDAKGAPGFVKGVGKVHFIETQEGTTIQQYDGDVNIGGALASVGQRMIDSVAKSIIRTAFETLDKALEARLEAKKTGKEVNFTPPTTNEFAADVAKEVVGGFTKVPEVRLVLYILPVVAVILILAIILSK